MICVGLGGGGLSLLLAASAGAGGSSKITGSCGKLGPSARVWVPLNVGRRWELPVLSDLASEADTASSTLYYWSGSHRTHLDSRGGDLAPTLNEKSSIKQFLTILNLPRLVEHLPFCFFPGCHGNKLIHVCKGCSFALEDPQRYKYPCLGPYHGTHLGREQFLWAWRG